MSKHTIFEQRTGEDRRDAELDIERAKISIRAAAALVTFIIGLLVTYFASVNTANARVSVLETQQKANDATIQRIEMKVDRLLERQR